MKPTKRLNLERPPVDEKKAEPAPDDSAGFLDLLKRSPEASPVFAALLFVIGWSWGDTDYSAFGLRMSQLGISNQEVLISSFHVIFSSAVSIVLVSVGIVAGATLIGYCARLKGLRHEFVVAFMLIGLLGEKTFSTVGN